MLARAQSIAALRANFQWAIPDRFNIGVDICDKHAALTPNAPAIVDVAADMSHVTYSFADLRDLSNQCANLLANMVSQGDRVAVLLPQSIDTAVVHIGALKLGCISLPLFTLFGPDALLHRLQDSGAKVVVTNAEGMAKIAAIRAKLPNLVYVLCTDCAQESQPDFRALCAVQNREFTPVDTAAEDPALLIYTSGTTGNPKGALHAHQVHQVRRAQGGGADPCAWHPQCVPTTHRAQNDARGGGWRPADAICRKRWGNTGCGAH